MTGDTTLTYVSHVRQFYLWALGEGLIEVNPAARLPVPRRRKRLPRPIGEEDLMHALGLAPPQVRLGLVLAAFCGLRAKELALLRRESILDKATPPVIIVTAETAKGGRVERIIPLSKFDDQSAIAAVQALPVPRLRVVRDPGQ